MEQSGLRGETEGKNQALLFAVDDEPMVLELIRLILQPEGYRLEVFRDGPTALEAFAAAKTKPSLLITDYSMGGMTGLELVQQCRKLNPDQKVLFVTGSVDQNFLANARPNGFLAKPFGSRRLVKLVRDLIA